MASISRVVDISEDAVAVRRRRRRALLRIGVPIFGIALVIVAIIAIALYSHSANRRGVLALSDDLLTTLDAQIAQRVSAFLDPCERALRIMRDIAVDMPRMQRSGTAERFAMSVLKELPQIASFYVGDSDGDFLMVRRHEDGVETKEIINGGVRTVLLIDRNAAGDEVSRREDPTDTYDPRTRPWFQGAVKGGEVYWTGIYIFFSDKKPGITVSTRVPERSGTDRVFGVDVTLEELSRFLSSLEIGVHGRALIMDNDGHLIAVPDSEKMIKPTGDQFIPPKVDELDDAILTAAFDRFRVEGQGRRIIEQDGTRYISSVTPLPGTTHKWWVLIVVPEDDFIGFVASNNRTALIMSLVIVLAVVGLAVLLVRQGLRSDRSIRLMTERGRIMTRQSTAYTAISNQIAAEAGESPPALTEGLVDVTAARRASVWRLTARNQILRCPDSYDRDSQGHAGGFELHRRELSAFFELLESGEELSLADAAADRRSAQFHQIIMQSLGSRALTVIPLRRGEQVVGAICLEDPGSLEGTKDFLRTVAAMLCSVLNAGPEEGDRPAEVAPAQTARERAPAEPSVHPILSADLAPSATERASLQAEYFPDVAVMALSLSGSLELAKKCGSGETGMAVQISECLQEIAAEHGVTYLKFVGQEAIAAAGFEKHDEDAMTWVAALAIAIRDRLSHLIDTTGHGAEFRIGLGFGGCYGCMVGRERQQFNLWGEAFETADIMAQSAAPGAIQASAGAYARLRQDFLFRPRGTFYLPGVGQSRTFVLAGQL
ncbi:MAG TPA: cache domain-containing protein [Dongiaceae bacterium]|jgi:class 3 adenylate cyclase|nr:cache domain-containing protein [Dongiaceae bacterium]